jgi:hypothetical protein
MTELQVGDSVVIVDLSHFAQGYFQVGDTGVVTSITDDAYGDFPRGDFYSATQGRVVSQYIHIDSVRLSKPKKREVKKTGFSKFMQKIEE